LAVTLGRIPEKDPQEIILWIKITISYWNSLVAIKSIFFYSIARRTLLNRTKEY
jgi:hypothetical protein